MNKDNLRSLIREGLSSLSQNKTGYVTRDVNVEYYAENLPDGDYISEGKAIINWNMDLDEREWGIKSFNPMILNMSIDLQIWSEEMQDYTSKTIELVKDREVIDEHTLSLNKIHEKDQVLPVEVEIYKNKIEVSFNYP